MALYSNVAPGDIRQQFSDHTVTKTFEVKASVVPIETRRSSLWLTAAAGFSDSSERVSAGTLYNDHFRTMSLELSQPDVPPWRRYFWCIAQR
jgi:hypothetical protein